MPEAAGSQRFTAGTPPCPRRKQICYFCWTFAHAPTCQPFPSTSRTSCGPERSSRPGWNLKRRSPSKRCGWCWFRLAEIYQYLDKPHMEIEHAYEQAIALLPDEPEVQAQYNKWKKR